MAETPIVGQTILLTGAGGSIASVLCERFVTLGAAKLVCLGLTESALYRLRQQLARLPGEAEIAYVLGSVTDLCLLEQVSQGVDLIIHAAAHKHVPLCEDNPCAAVLTNVGGTATVLSAARAHAVPLTILFSSDKAVQPASIMGATKQVAEMLVTQHGAGAVTARCGNVLDSAGSVLPLWRDQIAQGGPVTVTDERCERYFMTLDDVSTLVEGVVSMAPRQGTFVWEMEQSRRMIDLARELIAASGQPCEIAMIGLRPGDKLREEVYQGTAWFTAVQKVLEVDPVSSAKLCFLEELMDAAARHDAERTRHLLWEMVQ